MDGSNGVSIDGLSTATLVLTSPKCPQATITLNVKNTVVH